MCFAAVRKAGHDHTVLATSGCDSGCPERWTRTELWPSRAKSISSDGSLKPTYPLSLEICPGLERTGAERVEKWWTFFRDSSTVRGSTSASERWFVNMNLPSMDISERISAINRGEISKEKVCNHRDSCCSGWLLGWDFFKHRKLIVFFSSCDTCLQLQAVSHAPWSLFFCLFFIRYGLRGKGHMYQLQTLQYYLLFLLLSLGKMYDVQQDHVSLQRKTHLTDQ